MSSAPFRLPCYPGLIRCPGNECSHLSNRAAPDCRSWYSTGRRSESMRCHSSGRWRAVDRAGGPRGGRCHHQGWRSKGRCFPPESCRAISSAAGHVKERGLPWPSENGHRWRRTAWSSTRRASGVWYTWTVNLRNRKMSAGRARPWDTGRLLRRHRDQWRWRPRRQGRQPRIEPDHPAGRAWKTIQRPISMLGWRDWLSKQHGRDRERGGDPLEDGSEWRLWATWGGVWRREEALGCRWGSAVERPGELEHGEVQLWSRCLGDPGTDGTYGGLEGSRMGIWRLGREPQSPRRRARSAKPSAVDRPRLPGPTPRYGRQKQRLHKPGSNLPFMSLCFFLQALQSWLESGRASSIDSVLRRLISPLG